MRDLFGNEIEPEQKGKLARDFGVPPFSVLNAREGDWQNRKRAWLALGIESELGRGEESPHGKLASGKSPAQSNGQDLMKGESTP